MAAVVNDAHSVNVDAAPPATEAYRPMTPEQDYPQHIRFRPPPRILTPRLVLRAMTEDDLTVCHTFLSQIEVMKYMRSSVSQTMADTEKWFNARFGIDETTGKRRGEFCYMICLRDGDKEGEAIGTTGSRLAPNLGYQIGAGEKYWGKGYASEAAGAALDAICLQILEEKPQGWEDAYVKIEAELENVGSVKVAQKVGMKLHHTKVEDGRNVAQYRMYVKDWKKT